MKTAAAVAQTKLERMVTVAFMAAVAKLMSEAMAEVTVRATAVAAATKVMAELQWRHGGGTMKALQRQRKGNSKGNGSCG